MVRIRLYDAELSQLSDAVKEFLDTENEADGRSSYFFPSLKVNFI
jgi:hypothetical protein